jgi:hypothetical protein
MSDRNLFETEKNINRRKKREAFRQVTNKPAVVSGNKFMNNINKVNAILNEKVRLKGKETGTSYNIRGNSKSRVRNPSVLPSRVKPLVTRPALPRNVQNKILKKKEAMEYVNELINERERKLLSNRRYKTTKEMGKEQISTAIRHGSLIPTRKMRAGMQRQKNWKNRLVAFLLDDSRRTPHHRRLQFVKNHIRRLYENRGGLGVRPKLTGYPNLITYNSPQAGDLRRLTMLTVNLLKTKGDLVHLSLFGRMLDVDRTKNNLPNTFYPKIEQARNFLRMPANKRKHILNVMKNIKNKNGAAREDAMIEYQKHFLNRNSMVNLLKQRKLAALNLEIQNYKKEHGKKRKLPERFENERSKIARIGNLPTGTLKNMINSLKHNP